MCTLVLCFICSIDYSLYLNSLASRLDIIKYLVFEIQNQYNTSQFILFTALIIQ